MNIITVKASTRATGKSASKAVRKSEQVPCVLYGHDNETIHFQVADLTMRKLVYTTELHRLSLDLDGKVYDCILKEVDFHPVKDSPIHADFQLLMDGETIELEVPLKFIGKAKGQTDGGDISYLMHEIEVSVLPKDIPDHLEVDVTHLEIGDTMHVSDLSFPNIEIVSPGQVSVVAVTAKKVEEEVAEVEGVEGLEGEASDEDGDDESKSEGSGD